MGKNEPEAKQWFAIRVTYSREMALKEYLDRCRMESFIPMSYKEVIKGERKVRKLVPVIHNLVFVRSTREKLDEIKRDISLKIPSTPENTPPTIRTRSPSRRETIVGSK